jgi:O-antigen/teichoic acid export membrane protein
MSTHKRTTLTIGIFFLAIAVAILLYAVGLINWTLITPVVFVLCGLWLLALGAIRMGQPMRYERSGFSTITLGLIAIAVGCAWFVATITWVYSIAIILIVIAAIAIVAALQHK